MLNQSNSIQLYKEYSRGERKFHGIQLEKENLEQALLNEIDLRKAIINYANLRKADLSNADLRGASLVEANMRDVNLRDVNLRGANLRGANLRGANLRGADFGKANLKDANLFAARFIESEYTKANKNKNSLETFKPTKVDFRCANLTGAILIGFDLNAANLVGAVYDDKTSISVNFDPISAGMVHIKMMQKSAIDELLAKFNYLYSYGNDYLDIAIVTKYFDASRPEFDWLNKFKINKRNEISFAGTVSSFISYEQLYWFQQWIDSFSKICSITIKDFPRVKIVGYSKNTVRKLIPNQNYRCYKTRLSNIEVDSSAIYMTRTVYERLTSDFFDDYSYFYYCILSSMAENQFSSRAIKDIDDLLHKACLSNNMPDRKIINNLKLLMNKWLAAIDLKKAVIG